MSHLKFVTCILLCALMFASACIGATSPKAAAPAAPPSAAELESDYAAVWQKIADGYYNLDALNDWAQWKHKYDGKLHSLTDLYNALQAMTNSLDDPWTQFYSPADAARRQQEEKAGNVAAGLWILLDQNGAPYVELCEYGTPAYTSPIQAFDKILAVNGKPVTGLSAHQVALLLNGKVGDKLNIDYSRDGKPYNATLVLSAQQDRDSQAKVLPGGYLYLTFGEFDGQAVVALEKAIAAAVAAPHEPLKGIVLDLRGNPGGYVLAAEYISSMFLEKGTILSYESRTGRRLSTEVIKVVPPATFMHLDSTADELAIEKLLFDLPMVVLVNHTSRSAAETLTAALQDNHRAFVIGAVTYGKAIAYDDYPQDFGGRLRFTIGGLRSPNGLDWHHKGLHPDLIVDQPGDSAIDLQLAAGLNYLSKSTVPPAPSH